MRLHQMSPTEENCQGLMRSAYNADPERLESARAGCAYCGVPVFLVESARHT